MNLSRRLQALTIISVLLAASPARAQEGPEVSGWWAESQAIIHKGQTNLQFDSLVTHSFGTVFNSFDLQKKVGLFLTASGGDKYPLRAYGGLSVAPAPWIQVAAGGGYGYGGFVWLGNQNYAVVLTANYSRNVFWGRVKFTAKADEMVTLGIMADNISGVGPLLEIKGSEKDIVSPFGTVRLKGWQLSLAALYNWRKYGVDVVLTMRYNFF